MGDAYRETIVKTFREKAIRSAHIIDDMFPTYAELADPAGDPARFGEMPLALELYRMFRGHQIPCDVDNTVSGIKAEIERIRKSDLIVLDYNLEPNDTCKSTSLVRLLSRTAHFNTIIVYTLADDLDEVWRTLGIGLRGGWSEPSMGISQEAAEALASLVDGEKIGQPSLEIVIDCILGKHPALSPSPDVALYKQVFKENNVDEALHADLLRAIVHREVRSILKDDHETRDAELETVDGACREDVRWLQCKNCFVAIVGKRNGEGKGTPPERLFASLDEALCAWRPNILQIMISEIQNILEQEALAADELTYRDPNTQVGLCYFLLHALAEGGDHADREALAAPLHALLDKLVDGVRQRILTDGVLKDIGVDLVLSEIGRFGMTKDAKSPELLDFARKMAGDSKEVTANTAFMRLNAFLSTEPFRGDLTTGTIFTDGAHHWMCMSPACDLTGRAPSAAAAPWRADLHPMRPIVACRLKPVSNKDALRHAEDIRHVFLDNGGTFETFEIVNERGTPAWEFMFLDDGGRVARGEGSAIVSVTRMCVDEGPEGKVRGPRSVAMTIVGQLRPNYASRHLQQTGQWLSRIGVDFRRGIQFPG